MPLNDGQDRGFNPPLWISTDFTQLELAEVLTRRLTNEKSLYISVQKSDVTFVPHDLCQVFVDVPSSPVLSGGGGGGVWLRVGYPLSKC